ncbi:MAG: hypothetical protein CSA38_02485 [Flavobacteriales bacterium]|nr:MAG: hypothetical protein CSA38_02485 [Flavobacteriales bacterium]
MKKATALLSLVILLLNCNKIDQKTTSSTEKTDTLAINESDFKVEEIPQGCYFLAQNKDTTFININDNAGTIIGEIRHRIGKKDSIGDLMGFASEDTLKLEVQYKLNSDSIITEDIWFLKQYGNLYQGVGKKHHDGTYAHPSFVKFEGGKVYQPIDCKK